MEKKKTILKVKNTQTPLTKLLVNKGYRKIFTGTTNEIFVALDPVTGLVCLIIANQGSQHFKELVLPDAAIDYLFSVVYTNCKWEPTEAIEHTKIANAFIENQNYEYITGSSRKISTKENVEVTSETLIKNLKEEYLVSIAQIAHVNDILSNIILTNLNYEEVAAFTDYLVKLGEKARQQQIEQTEKKEKEK